MVSVRSSPRSRRSRQLRGTPRRAWVVVVTALLGLGAVTVQTAAAGQRSAASGTATSTLSPQGWITTRDGVRRVQPLSGAELTPPTTSSAVRIAVDETRRYQSKSGVGAALTESSAHLLMRLSATRRTAALRALFDPNTGAGIDLVRVPLGASDFALSHYTYDDVPAGQTDLKLSRFSLAHDDAEMVPVLREALKINPRLQVWGLPGAPRRG